MASSKLPFFQFYPSDWMGDELLRACSPAARAVWMDFLCLMWNSPRRGYLMTKEARPFTDEQLARVTGCAVETFQTLLEELHQACVFSARKDGIIFSRRFVREEKKRAQDRLRKSEDRHSEKHGSEKKDAKSKSAQQNCPADVRDVSTKVPRDIVICSEAIYSEEKTHTEAAEIRAEIFDAEAAFERIWQAYPPKGRTRRPLCEQIFSHLFDGRNDAALAERILAPLLPDGKWTCSKNWSKNEGQFIFGLADYLTNKRWLEEPEQKGEWD